MATNEELYNRIVRLQDDLLKLTNQLDGNMTDDEKSLAERIDRLERKLDETNNLLIRYLDNI